ncbi:hypothetical protein [Nonomuraea sp. NPDC003201]
MNAELDAEPGRLVIHHPKRPAELSTQPDGVDLLSWLREVAPDLPEPVMPVGRPVVPGSVVERYGYNVGTDR